MFLNNIDINLKKAWIGALVIGLGILALPATAQNLIPSSTWNIGSGSVGIFNDVGTIIENNRIWGTTPSGTRGILWEGGNEPDAGSDGGWATSPFNVDHTKMYRFTTWIKRTGSLEGNTYLGCATVLSLAGTLNTNPYFLSADLPDLDKWYLVVGFIHGSGDPSTEHYGAIYDGETGEKIRSILDYKFETTTTTTTHRSFMYYNTNVNDRQFHFAPRVDLVDGSEPPIETLGFSPNAFMNTDVKFSKSVGIATTDNKGYELAVGGTAIAEEVVVKLEGSWPDYVFDPNYELPSLEATEEFIRSNGHLPGVPAATEVAEKGILLGNMNKVLLKKIEELTLHMIATKKENEAQNKLILQLQSELTKIKNSNND